MKYTEYEGEDTQEVAVPDMPNLHQLLEEIKATDNRIEQMRSKRMEMVSQYHTEKDRLDAHYEMVINGPKTDPGPTMGRYSG